MKNEKVDISLVIPCFNEAGNIQPLWKDVETVLLKSKKEWEVWWINDGSRDETEKELEALYQKHPDKIRIIQFRHNFGKASALKAGFSKAKGDLIITMDGDGQDDPAEIPKLIVKINEGYDLVSGWKQHRKDTFIKNKTSKIFNWMTNKISKTQLHDHNCGFKAYRQETVVDLDLYGELHRFIPVIVAAQGYRVTEVPVEHRRRYSGKTKYGKTRFVNGFLDFLTVLFITRYRVRPLHMFGYAGLLTTLLGMIGGLYLTFIKLVGGQAIGERPLLLLSVMLMIMGVQLGAIGLVGEQITASVNRGKNDFVIQKELDGE